jgi:hypothetical protein
VQPAPARVLFIGNSLTRANDLPLVVEALAAAAGRPIEVQARVGDGLSLDDHWTRGAREAIAAGGWTWVVLQQGPSALPASRHELRAAAKRYAPPVREAGARLAFYAVWPSEPRRGDLDRAAESYRLAARDVDARLLAVGDAWRAAWQTDRRLPLYGPDRFHPSREGTYLAALVITAGLLEIAPADLPCEVSLRGGTRLGVSPDHCAVMRRAAAAALP